MVSSCSSGIIAQRMCGTNPARTLPTLEFPAVVATHNQRIERVSRRIAADNKFLRLVKPTRGSKKGSIPIQWLIALVAQAFVDEDFLRLGKFRPAQ